MTTTAKIASDGSPAPAPVAEATRQHVGHTEAGEAVTIGFGGDARPAPSSPGDARREALEAGWVAGATMAYREHGMTLEAAASKAAWLRTQLQRTDPPWQWALATPPQDEPDDGPPLVRCPEGLLGCMCQAPADPEPASPPSTGAPRCPADGGMWEWCRCGLALHFRPPDGGLFHDRDGSPACEDPPPSTGERTEGAAPTTKRED